MKSFRKIGTLGCLLPVLVCGMSPFSAHAEYGSSWEDALQAFLVYQANEVSGQQLAYPAAIVETPAMRTAPAPVAVPAAVTVGRASYYGAQYHGKATASGEPYDMYAMTAAHPTLPFGTYIRVTNLQNGRAVGLRVNDRGPFKPGRIVDVSQAAAEQLGMILHGTAEVQVEVVR